MWMQVSLQSFTAFTHPGHFTSSYRPPQICRRLKHLQAAKCTARLVLAACQRRHPLLHHCHRRGLYDHAAVTNSLTRRSRHGDSLARCRQRRLPPLLFGGGSGSEAADGDRRQHAELAAAAVGGKRPLALDRAVTCDGA